MDAKNDLKSKLAETPFFAEIPEEKLLDIAENAQDKIVSPNAIIFKEGDPANSYYIIDHGRVRIFGKVREDLEINLAVLGPGDHFGVITLPTEELRLWSAEAIEETHLIVIPKNLVTRLVSDYPHVSLTFVKKLSSLLLRDNMRPGGEAEHHSRIRSLSWFDFLIIFGLSLLLSIIFNLSNPNGIAFTPEYWSDEAVATVTPSLAMSKYVEGETLFVDARPRSLYEKRHIKSAVSLPLPLFEVMYTMRLKEIDKKKEIIVYGRTISRLYDEQVARKLILRGYENTETLSGGLSLWERYGYPVEP